MAAIDPGTLFLFAAAPCVGSFLGVVAVRLPEGGAVLLGRSRCPRCGTQLGVRDLLPLVSWLARLGRCRYCGGAVSAFYPAIELAALGIAVWAWTEVSGGLLWLSSALGWTLLTLAAMDWRSGVLSDRLTLPLAAAGLAVAAGFGPERLLDSAIGAAAGFLFFWGLGILYRRLRGRDGLGLGDAKLLAAGGAWVGWQGLPGVVLIAAVAGLAWVLLQSAGGRRPRWTDALAFGPSLGLAIWLVWLYGPLTFG